jgi:hypothetical protein
MPGALECRSAGGHRSARHNAHTPMPHTVTMTTLLPHTPKTTAKLTCGNGPPCAPSRHLSDRTAPPCLQPPRPPPRSFPRLSASRSSATQLLSVRLTRGEGSHEPCVAPARPGGRRSRRLIKSLPKCQKGPLQKGEMVVSRWTTGHLMLHVRRRRKVKSPTSGRQHAWWSPARAQLGCPRAALWHP